MAWTDRTKPTTNWADIQVEGISLTWAEAGDRNLTWNNMDMLWGNLTSTDWTKRTGVSTSWS